MASPAKNRVLRYLEATDDSYNPKTRTPLAPTSKINSSTPNFGKYSKEKTNDLDNLSRELNVTTPTPSKMALLRTKFETPSATVSSFKSPLSKSSANSRYESPFKKQPVLQQNVDLQPRSTDWNLDNSPSNKTSKDSPGYEYLCRIEELKRWLETVLNEPIKQEPVELIAYIRNGIHLAKLANVVLPVQKRVFSNDSKLQFRHTENINRFFELCECLNVPDLFRIELTDLYDAKNVPKAWLCLRTISYILHKMDPRFPQVINLFGTLSFTPEDIRTANRALIGTGLPNFAGADGDETSKDSRYMNSLTSPSKPEQKARADVVAKHLRNDTHIGKLQHLDKENPFLEEKKSTTTTHRFQPAPEKKVEPTKRRELFSDDLYEKPTPREEYKVSASAVDILINGDTATGLVKLQSLARGANFRYRMFADRIILKSYSEEIGDLISIIRGNQSRKVTIHRNRSRLLLYEDAVIVLQSLIRAVKVKKLMSLISLDIQSFNLAFHPICKGAIQRRRRSQLKQELEAFEGSLTRLQAHVKMKLYHLKVSVVLQHKDTIEEGVLAFQSLLRRRIYERNAACNLLSRSPEKSRVDKLQALIRGQRTRSALSSMDEQFNVHAASLFEFQGIIRGGIVRTRLCNSVLLALFNEEFELSSFTAKIRGIMIRREIEIKKRVLKKLSNISVVPVQSLIRGVLVRFNHEIKLDDAYNEIQSIIILQSHIRSSRVRRSFSRMEEYYKANEAKVVKAQSYIKSHFTRVAYRALMNQKNIPLTAIRRFAYLLTDNEDDFSEEMQLTQLKDDIIRNSKSNEELEQRIENLDIKLGLLDKNKITVDDLVKGKDKIKAKAPKALNLTSLETISKSSRQRIKLYQSMLYFLQTKPVYFLRLYEEIPISSEELKVAKDLKNSIVEMFQIKSASVGHHSREEFFFMKFIHGLMEQDSERFCHNTSDITKTTCTFWINYLLHFNNLTYQRQHLRSIFGKFVTRIVDDDELDFESDPMVIYEGIMQKEVKVNGSTDKTEDITPQEAIKDPEVSAKFVENLMSLREFATDALDILERSINRFPLYIKMACKQSYRLSKKNFPHKTDQQHLAVAGVIFIKHYISNILQCPENFGYLAGSKPTAHNLRAKNNLRYLSRVLLQVFSMKPFNDNFLKPLNDYVESSLEATRGLVQNLVLKGDLESEYGYHDFDDIASQERPQLTMKVSDMILLEKILTQNLDIVTPTFDDQLYNILIKLKDDVNSAHDFMALSELGTVTLSLNPTTKEDSLADSRTRSLMTQVKRCVLYIIRVQEGDDLLEILISGIEPAHEQKFKELILEEKEESESQNIDSRRPYHRTSLGDLSLTSYHDLKKMCLEILLKLEKAGQLTRKNSYQEVLNEVAFDIKTKDAKRSGRSQQVAIAENTSKKIIIKQDFLQKQLRDYNEHIDYVVSSLQLKPKDRKIFNIIPVFSRQYFYQRELKKANRLPKFGAIKYTAKKLLDQKVLVDYGGILNNVASSLSKLDFVFSCHELKKFNVEVISGSVTIPGASAVVTLDNLLDCQYEDRKTLHLFEKLVMFDTQNLSSLIFKNFYDLKD